ncbi:MAG: Murein hydrolase activator NlpD precursor [candidate division BRC1 bacterium ADurb.BinA364]|nr:MAG: Murein hydrolase activator NlpD precursor [candidate division BRC1 bacterium ADurb.BinA364]
MERIDAERAELEKAMVAYRGQWETLNREAERLESEIGVSEEELAHLRAYGQQSRESLAALQIRRQALRKLVEHLMRQKSAGAEAQAGPSGAGRDDSFLIAGQSGEPSAAWTAPPISALPEPEEALVLAAAESPGVDIYSSEWRSIHVVAPGRIAFAGDLRGYGKTIVVDHEDGYFTVYAYLERLFAATGDRAARGDVIALSARRPEGSAQPAAHFEVWHGETPVRPESWSGLPGDARRALLDGVFEP